MDEVTVRKGYNYNTASWEEAFYNLNDSMDLSTVLYASWGRGGGTGNLGNSSNRIRNDIRQIDLLRLSKTPDNSILF